MSEVSAVGNISGNQCSSSSGSVGIQEMEKPLFEDDTTASIASSSIDGMSWLGQNCDRLG